MAGKPMHIDQLIERIDQESGLSFQRATVVSNLSRYVKHHDTFTRPAPNTYGLIEFDRAEMDDMLTDPTTSQLAWMAPADEESEDK